jgi:hypothetical protein
MGIPTVTVTRQGFSGVVTKAFASVGFPSEASMVVYPERLFLPGSDLEPINEKMGELVDGLTEWEPTIQETGVYSPDKITITAKDRKEAVERMNHHFIRNLWSDGLPVVPPTEAAVEEMVRGTDRPRDEEVGNILPRGGVATVESLAVLMVMAGGRPEYMPVFIAIIEALVDPKMQHKRMNTTTCSVYPVVVVNGSVAEDIRLSSGYGCLGPDPNRPAGAAIGRALRFALQDMGGAVPGNTTMSIYGGPARYTGLVFAEDEKALPQGWPSLAEEQGFGPDTNVVTIYAVSSTTNVPGGETGNEDAASASLNRAAGALSIPNGNYWFQPTPYNENGSAGILLIGPGTAQGLVDLGWTKSSVQDYLWENSKVPEDELTPRINTWWVPVQEILEYPMPISMRPDGIEIVVAGGDQSGHMMWLQVGCCPEELVSREVELPSSWPTLLDEAETDLGPPAAD